jgi:class 3 adenylate cyclase
MGLVCSRKVNAQSWTKYGTDCGRPSWLRTIHATITISLVAGRTDGAGSMPKLPTGTVTFLFTDIEGSTALWERDRQAMATAVERVICGVIVGLLWGK